MFTYNIRAENDFLYMAYFDFFVLIHSETFFLTLCFSVIITLVRTDKVELICAILLVTILSCVFCHYSFFAFHMFLSLVILIEYFMSFLKTFLFSLPVTQIHTILLSQGSCCPYLLVLRNDYFRVWSYSLLFLSPKDSWFHQLTSCFFYLKKMNHTHNM